MVRKLLPFIFFLLVSPLYAQNNAYQPQLLSYFGAPSGSCVIYQQGIDVVTGNFYVCDMNSNPTRGTWQAVGGSSGPFPCGSSGQLQYNNSNSCGAVVGSSVTPSTGAILLTAGADTTTPLAIASHSNTQSASLLDLNNQSTGSRTALLAVHGRGIGSYTPSALTAVANFEQQSVATATYGLTITNRQAGGSGGALSVLTAGESDGGVGSWCGGNTVGDGNGNFLCISFDSTKGVLIQPNSVSPSTTSGLVPLTVQALASGQTADLLDIKNSGGSVLASFDKSGNLTAPNTPQEICTGQIALSTGAINSGTRATNTLSCSGLSTSTDSISCTFSGDTNAVTGYAPSASGGLTLKTWVSANTVNVDQVNDTGGSITPGAATVNCKGIR